MLSAMHSKGVRPPAVAGAFYPRRADVLEVTVAGLLANVKSASRGRIRAVIVPHAGYVYSGAVAAEAFAGLETLKGRIERVVVIGPSHCVPVRGIAVPTVDSFCTPLGAMLLDQDALVAVADLRQIAFDDDPHEPEHALEVELPFLQAVLGPVPIVPLVVGSARAREVADVLERLWDETTLIVVSSDLSHYHDYETARRLDAATAEAIDRLDERAISTQDACGALPLRGMLIEAKRRGLEVERLDLRNSGDTAGDRRRVVGYGAWVIREAASAARK
jgi:AmmeMemoRadiSam system protein B